MPGIPTHIQIFNRAREEKLLQGAFQVADPNLGYAYLGAIGASLGDFLPDGDSGTGLPTFSRYWQVWNQIFALLFGYDPDNPQTDQGRGLCDILTIIHKCTDQLYEANKTHDAGKLPNSGDLAKLKQAALDLNAFAPLLASNAAAFTARVGDLINDSMTMKPDAGGMPPDTQSLPMRDLLHWRGTGMFLRLLFDSAAGNPVNHAYAVGYLTSYAGKVCGSPFINSIAGGPYRTTWWRNRFIANYVDSWVWGFYKEGASMSGDTPDPPYEKWTNSLCGANLHAELSEHMGGQQSPFAGLKPDDAMDLLRGKKDLTVKLPKEFCDYWFDAFQTTFDEHEITPGWIAGLSQERRRDILTYAFLQLWMVLWFQTGTGLAGLGCKPAEPEPYPAQCSDKPRWDEIENAQGQGSASNPNPPPVPQSESEDDLGKTISGIVAALLGALTWGAGEAALGILGAIVGVDLILSGDDSSMNWDGLKCAVYWYEWDLYLFGITLHDILKKSGFSFPWAEDLAETLARKDGSIRRVGIERVKSRRSGDYPKAQPTTMADMAAWLDDPPTGVENPATVGYLTEGAYPSYFIDDPQNKIGASGSIGETPALDDHHLAKTENGLAAPTGNALLNIADLINRLKRKELGGPGKSFPSWNLDADRGMYFWTWEIEGPYDVNNATNLKLVKD
jgi:hypothetical protein